MYRETMSEEEGRGPELGFLSRGFSIFHSPGRVFEDIDRGAPWWQPWVWASLVNIAIGYALFPIQMHLYRLNPGGLPEDQVARMIENMQSFPLKPIGIIIGAPVTVLFVALAFAAISYVAVSVLSERADFKKHLTIYLYASIVAWVGVLFSNMVVRWNGIENIRSARDAIVSFGPAAFVPEGHRIGYAVLSTLDAFSIWFYVLMGLGVIRVFRLSRWSAVLVVVPVWLLYVLIALIGARLAAVA